MINVIIADDHEIVIDGLVSILDKEDDINVVGKAMNGDDVIKLLRNCRIDVAVLDIEMPGKTGVELSLYIKEKHPNVKILILTMYKTQEFVRQIISAGANGYILKNKGSEELVKAIRVIKDGHSYIGQEITEVLIEALKTKNNKAKKPEIKFTKREKEVLELTVEGLTAKEIGKKLFIAKSTVETHRKNLIDKADAANVKELIRMTIKNGWV